MRPVGGRGPPPCAVPPGLNLRRRRSTRPRRPSTPWHRSAQRRQCTRTGPSRPGPRPATVRGAALGVAAAPRRGVARPHRRHVRRRRSDRGRRGGRRTPGAWSSARPCSGFVAVLAVAIGASMPSSPFKLEMPGVWFFGEPSTATPSRWGVYFSLAAVYGGLLPVHAGVVGDGPPLPPPPRRAGQDHDGRVRPVVAARPGHRPAVQPGRLLVRGPGRDGQPPHEPVPVRALRARQQLLHRPGRPAVGQRPGALRPDVPPARRLLRPDHLPQRAGHHRPAPRCWPWSACCSSPSASPAWPSCTTGTAPSCSR